VIFFYLLVKNR